MCPSARETKTANSSRLRGSRNRPIRPEPETDDADRAEDRRRSPALRRNAWPGSPPAPQVSLRTRTEDLQTKLVDGLAPALLADGGVGFLGSEEGPLPRDGERALVVGPDPPRPGLEGPGQHRLAIRLGGEHDDLVRSWRCDGSQGSDVRKAQPAAEAVVDASGGAVKRRVRAENRDAAAGQRPQVGRGGQIRPDLLGSAEEDRVVADDQFGLLGDRLRGRRPSDGEAGHDAIDLGVGIAPEQAHVVPRLSQPGRGELLEPPGQFQHGSHVVPPDSSQRLIASQSRRVTGPGAGNRASPQVLTGMIPRTELLRNTSSGRKSRSKRPKRVSWTSRPRRVP